MSAAEPCGNVPALSALYLALQDPDPAAREPARRELWGRALKSLPESPRAVWRLVEWGVVLLYEAFQEYKGMDFSTRQLLDRMLRLCPGLAGQELPAPHWEDREAFVQERVDPTAPVRAWGVWSLGQARNIQAATILEGALRDSAPTVRRLAAEALGNLGRRESVPQLCGLLQDPDYAVQRQAVCALGRIGDRAALPALRRKARRWNSFVFVEDGKIRDTCQEVIAELEKGAVSLTGAGLAEEPPSSREAEPFDPPEALSRLYLGPEDPTPAEREQARRELWGLARPALTEGPRDFWWLVAWGVEQFHEPFQASFEESPSIGTGTLPMREWFDRMARSCVSLAQGEGAPPVDPEAAVRAWAVRALGQDPDDQTGRALLLALQDGVPAIRVGAAEALGNLGLRDAVPSLCEALEDPVWKVQRQAISALGRIGDPAALPALRRKERSLWSAFLYRELPEVRYACRAAIETIEKAAEGRLTLPRPAGEPEPSTETLPRPAGEPEPNPETLPRPAEEGDEPKVTAK